jgi:hypothetical protein
MIGFLISFCRLIHVEFFSFSSLQKKTPAREPGFCVCVDFSGPSGKQPPSAKSLQVFGSGRLQD